MMSPQKVQHEFDLRNGDATAVEEDCVRDIERARLFVGGNFREGAVNRQRVSFERVVVASLDADRLADFLRLPAPSPGGFDVEFTHRNRLLADLDPSEDC